MYHKINTQTFSLGFELDKLSNFFFLIRRYTKDAAEKLVRDRNT